MSKPVRILFAVLTLLTALAMLGLSIFALTIPHVGLFVTCLALTAGFGLFVYHDYQYFFGVKKDESPK
jgi:hypothetical protein